MRNGARSPVFIGKQDGSRRSGGAYLGVALLAAAALVADTGLGVSRAQAQQQPQPHRESDIGPVGWDAYREMDAFAQSRGAEQSLQFSSFDRSGGNDDGFDGTYSCLRNNERGCVIAERAGAGELSSLWFTREPMGDVTGTGNIIIELDDQVVLDAPLSDVVDGELGDPFSWPLVGNADDSGGGAVIKVPMPYQDSMRVTVENNPHFYHVNYRAFPDANGVDTFDPDDSATDVLDRLRRFGVDDPKPPAREAESAREDFRVAPGESTTLGEVSGPGRIDQLRLRLPEVSESPQVVDDGRAYGPGGGSSFTMGVDPGNAGARLVRRYDPGVAEQNADVFVDGEFAGQWRSGPASPGEWDEEVLDVPPELTAGKSEVTVTNSFDSSNQRGVNEFRYDMYSDVDGDRVRSDVLDLGPNHPGEEEAHDYRIDNQVAEEDKRVARYAGSREEVARSKEVLENTRLRITFDGNTTVDAPVGEFFGSGLGEYDVRTLMSSIDAGPEGWYTSWWPMPFRDNATVELVNDSGVPITDGSAEITSGPGQMDEDAGYFHATHKSGRTQPGQDWNFLEASGAGTFYGVTHSMRGRIPPGTANDSQQPQSLDTREANQRNYLEGDERFYVDGKSSPAWHGTGTEDLYEGGWYFRDGITFGMPLAGNPSHEVNGDGCQYDCTGAYRLLVGDAVPFSDGGEFGIEHGPENDEPSDYSSTAYWYGGKQPEQRTTDEVDVADPVSRDQHGYQAEGEHLRGLRATFEGNRTPEEITRETSTASGPISFDVDVDEDNSGVRLRRLSDQQQAYQQADVRIDGEPAGRWLQPLGNGFHRWLEDTFDVPPELTQGKDSVRVELFPVNSAPDWSAAKYTAISRTP